MNKVSETIISSVVINGIEYVPKRHQITEIRKIEQQLRDEQRLKKKLNRKYKQEAKLKKQQESTAQKKYNLSIELALRIINTDKAFMCFDYDSNNRILVYKFTNDIKRYENKYSDWRDIELLKLQIHYIEIS